jgi:hypothetical protein
MEVFSGKKKQTKWAFQQAMFEYTGGYVLATFTDMFQQQNRWI